MKSAGEVRLDDKRNDQMAFHALADYQNHVIGWLQRGYSSLGDGAVVRFPRSWMSSGKCRFSPTMLIGRLIVDLTSFQENYWEERPDFYRSLVGKV